MVVMVGVAVDARSEGDKFAGCIGIGLIILAETIERALKHHGVGVLCVVWPNVVWHASPLAAAPS